MKRLLATTAAAVFALSGTAFAANSITTKGLSVSGDTVTLPKVMANQDGYLVIHAVKNGKVQAPQSVGHTMIHKGENDNVAVTIERPLKPGQTYVAMLHKETNNDGKYDFGKGMTKVDTPVMAKGKAVTQKFTLKKSEMAMSGNSMSSGKAMTTGSTKNDTMMTSPDSDMDGDSK